VYSWQAQSGNEARRGTRRFGRIIEEETPVQGRSIERSVPL